MNADKENAVNHCLTCLECQNMENSKAWKETTPHEVLAKPLEVVGTSIFIISNEHLLCIVDYYSKFPVVKKVKGMSAKDLVQTIKVVITEFGSPEKYYSDAGIIYSEQFKEFCRCLT